MTLHENKTWKEEQGVLQKHLRFLKWYGTVIKSKIGIKDTMQVGIDGMHFKEDREWMNMKH